MGKSQQTFGKSEREKKRLKKRKDKELKKLARKENNSKGASLEDQLVYVNHLGQLTDTPPDPDLKVEVDAESIVLGVPTRVEVYVDPIRKGKIEFFNDSKGFGFIKENETNEKYFVHISQLIDEVGENDKVTFELEKGLKGMNAVRVKKA